MLPLQKWYASKHNITALTNIQFYNEDEAKKYTFKYLPTIPPFSPNLIKYQHTYYRDSKSACRESFRTPYTG
jgi:hypothetical protein